MLKHLQDSDFIEVKQLHIQESWIYHSMLLI